jgi:hypothetical protein
MFLYAAVGLCGTGLLLVWLVRLRTPPATWQVVPGGLRAEPFRWNRIVLAVLLTAGAGLLVANEFFGTPESSQPYFLGCLLVAVELGRTPSGPVTLTPAGLVLGHRVFAWADVHQAYLVGRSVELRLTPRWITWFGDRRVYLRGRDYLVPANEMHWLIQHYLLFPAHRASMEALPERVHELPV